MLFPYTIKTAELIFGFDAVLFQANIADNLSLMTLSFCTAKHL
jgi:hypothetical protein